jgi:hypothetical protein
MSALTSIAAAVRTRPERRSGTSITPRLIISQGEREVFDREMISAETVGSLKRKECLYYFEALPAEGLGVISDERLAPDDLQVWLGLDELVSWAPELALVWARSREKGTIPLALDLDLPLTLSGDERRGVPSAPVRRVGPGSDDTPIKQLLLIAVTYDAPYAGTDDPVWLRVVTEAGTVVQHVITDTPQTDLEIDTANIYEIPVRMPFTRAELAGSAAGAIHLGIQGSDKWVPKRIFLFGLDEASATPDRVVPLVWMSDPGPLSADPTEGVPSIQLPLD